MTIDELYGWLTKYRSQGKGNYRACVWTKDQVGYNAVDMLATGDVDDNEQFVSFNLDY